MDYLEWNDLLAHYYFQPEMAGRDVLLYCNQDLINSISDNQNGIEDFISAVKTGPHWVNKKVICQKALQTYTNWRQRDLEYPPYIGYLALFVLADDVDPENLCSRSAYYPKLNNLLGEHNKRGKPPNFEDMWELWVDLEIWSKEDKHEDLGRFTPRQRFSWWKYAGWPISQTLLSFEERKNLPLIFSEADLDPTNIPSAKVICRALIHFGRRYHWLMNRTIKLLEIEDEETNELSEALIELVTNELSGWDGYVPDIQQDRYQKSQSVRLGIRVCLELDQLGQRVNTFLCIKTNRAFPDSTLSFNCSADIGPFECRESELHWSTRMQIKEGVFNKPFNASTLDWTKNYRLDNPEHDWHALVKGSEIKLFVKGYKADAPYDWIEVNRLERNQEFYLTCTEQNLDMILNWGMTSCDNFNEVTYSGLPHHWRIFFGQNAKKSCDDIELLTLSCVRRIELFDGIKAYTYSGNRYLSFALPKIRVLNASGSETVKVNGANAQVLEPGIWKIPEDSIHSKLLEITVQEPYDDIITKLSIYSVKPELPFPYPTLVVLDQYGNNSEIPSSDCYAIGAIVNHAIIKKEMPRILPLHLAKRILFIGSTQDRYVEWPKYSVPRWSPVWAIAFDKDGIGKVHYCGSYSEDELPKRISLNLSDIRAAFGWNEAVSPSAGKYLPPELPAIRARWALYEKVANNDR